MAVRTVSLSTLATAALDFLTGLVEPIFVGLQKLLGIRRMPWAFLMPNLLIILVFALLPVLLNVVYSVTGGDGFYPNQRPFVGGENFAITFQCGNYLDPASCRRDLFWRAFYNTLAFVPIQVIVMTVLSLLTAVVLDRPLRGRGFFRAVFFFPVMLSPVVVALVWKWILQRQGLLNAAMMAGGGTPVEWLSNPQSAFFWSVFITVWARMGFYTLILLAGLQSIPRDVYEAARMDSAKPWRAFTHITLPLLRPTLLVVLVLALIAAVQTFDELYVLTGGGPGSATVLLIQYIYETGFATIPHNLGLAAAASMLVGGILLVLTLVQLRFAGRSYDG
jgi:alpha-1,4-digalacturonate transport system permease protein